MPLQKLDVFLLKRFSSVMFSLPLYIPNRFFYQRNIDTESPVTLLPCKLPQVCIGVMDPF